MSITESDYVRVVDRATALGCNVPSGLAIVPSNFQTASNRGELLMGAKAATIKTLFRNNAVPFDEFMQSGERAPTIVNKDFDWNVVMFVGATLLSNNPDLVAIALSVIANYVTRLLQGMPNEKAKLSIVVERKKDGVCKMLSFEGDAEAFRSIEALNEAIRRFGDE